LPQYFPIDQIPSFSLDAMSKASRDPQFWDIADSFIHKANEHCANADRRKVGAALLYAAARFNSFVAAAASQDEVTFRADREKALEYFTGEFRKMLGENLDDLADHFADYIRSNRGAGT
jgi:uncharacterized protein DUF3144